jgi:putative endopeptidase
VKFIDRNAEACNPAASCRWTTLVAALVIAPFLLAPSLSGAQAAAAAAPGVMTASDDHGIQVKNMDPKVKPGDDFYLYTNGGWLAKTELTADRGGIGVFSALADQSNKNTAAIIKDAAASNAKYGTDARKIADLYNAYMDEAGIEAKGMAPIAKQFAAIDAIKDKQGLATALGGTLRNDVDALNNTNFHTANIFGLWVAPGFSDSDHYAAYLIQGGIVLPNRDYYLADDEHMKALRGKYAAYVAAMLKLAGKDNADNRAAKVIALETAMAKVQTSLADNEIIARANNPWKRTEFEAKAPGLDWDAYFAAAGLSNQDSFIVWEPTAFTGEAALVASTPLDTWKDWLTFHLINAYGGVLPKAVADTQFDFFGKTMSGIPQQRPRWQRGVGVVNGYLGDAVGKIYAEKYFSPEAKAQGQQLVANLIAAYHKRIAALDWLAPSTKAEAQAKLDTLYVGIGYPDSWRDYSGYEVRGDDAFGNAWRGRLFDYHYWVGQLGQPVDKHRWTMEPQTVNAVNLPLQNALSFPAAILQPPFFDAKAPAAVNYGAIGSVIGHEISHTFDAEGSAFDSKGAVRNWWTEADHKHFEEQAEKLEKQYDGYEVAPGVKVNGKQTIDENIADLGGVAAAYDGYRAATAGRRVTKQDGFDGDQQFYIAFGQNWAEKIREAILRQQVLTDGHSPSEFRADTVRNSDAWYKAFDVKPGDKLYLKPEDRVKIW